MEPNRPQHCSVPSGPHVRRPRLRYIRPGDCACDRAQLLAIKMPPLRWRRWRGNLADGQRSLDVAELDLCLGQLRDECDRYDHA